MSEPAEKIDQVEAQEPETPEVNESVKPVGVNRFGVAQEKRNEFVAFVKNGTDPEDVLKPDFWTHIARHLGRGDIVEVCTDDLAWEMSVRVLDRGHNWANVRKRYFIEHETAEIQSELPTAYKVDWAGQTDMFRVTFNGEVLKKGFATEALANRFASNHAQALKR